MDALLNLNLENIESSSLANGFSPVKIKLATSNLCNGQCVTCNSTLSSAWAALEGKSSQYKSLDVAGLTIEWEKVVSLSFVGGEPLLEKKNFAILEKLLDAGNSNCFISIVTNGSIELTESQKNTLSQFNKLNICLSIDGVGNAFEYMRYPLQWDRLLTNLELFKTIAEVSVSCMISNLNIYYYSEYVSFFERNQLNYLCKQVTSPAIFAPGNLPPAAMDMVRVQNPNHQHEINSFLSTGTFTPEKYQQLKLEIARQDALKGIRLADYMLDVTNFL